MNDPKNPTNDQDYTIATLVDLVGKRFGKLIVVSRSHKDSDGKWFWICLCDCGKSACKKGARLKSGKTKSCGCNKLNNQGAKTHGYWNSPTWISWSCMKRRCLSPSTPGYHRYGGRGITFHPSWSKFENFLADMAERPHGKTLDRIDSDGNYERSNCRWATAKEQTANRGIKYNVRRKNGTFAPAGRS